MDKKIGDSSFVNFNKELIFGEIGAIVCAPLSAFIASIFTKSASIISIIAVIGAILGAAIFWIVTRVYNNRKKVNYASKGLIEDITYFTPAAFLITLLVYYPSLFFLSKYFIIGDKKVVLSVITSQLIAFFLFLLAINGYRTFLIKFFNKKL